MPKGVWPTPEAPRGIPRPTFTAVCITTRALGIVASALHTTAPPPHGLPATQPIPRRCKRLPRSKENRTFAADFARERRFRSCFRVQKSRKETLMKTLKMSSSLLAIVALALIVVPGAMAGAKYSYPLQVYSDGTNINAYGSISDTRDNLYNG